ncbi:MAG: molybdopterin-dependent oxidoreductase [Ilumatobacteraceae bacterium]
MFTQRLATALRTLVVTLAAPALLVSACGSSASSPTATENSAYDVVSKPQLVPGDALPAPTGPVVLTLSGRIERTNGGNEARFDLDTLERLGLVEYRVDDQQAEGRTVTFRGVLVSDLLAFVGADPSASTLRTVALNDYAVEIPMTDIVEYPVMLATEVDGERMPVARYGPTRIVYPSESYDLDPAIYEPRWIWQLASIDVS